MGNSANVVKSRDGAMGNGGWQTPEAIFTALAKEFGPFDLDPTSAHNAYTATRVPTYCTEEGEFWRIHGGPFLAHPENDGMNIDWKGRVYCNPPYKRVEQWVKKASDAAKAGALVVMLLIPSTDAGWFHRYCWDERLSRGREGVEVRFRQGRIRFVHPDPAMRETAFKGFRPISGNMVVIFHPWDVA